MAEKNPDLWNVQKRPLPAGRIVCAVMPPYSNDTLSTCKAEFRILEPALRLANTEIRVNANVTVETLRQIPELDRVCSDTHLSQLIEGDGELSPRKMAIRIIADASGRYSEETIERYLKFPTSRQIKKAKPGRPRLK